MNVQQLRKALLMSSDAAEVRIAFREVMVGDGTEYIDAPVGGTCIDVADNSFTIYESEEDSCSSPTEIASSSPESPSGSPPPS